VSEDVLKKYAQLIAVAERTESIGRDHPRAMICIRELAAEARALLRELRIWKDIVHDGRVANKELNTRIAQLQAQLAELETYRRRVREAWGNHPSWDETHAALREVIEDESIPVEPKENP